MKTATIMMCIVLGTCGCNSQGTREYKWEEAVSEIYMEISSHFDNMSKVDLMSEGDLAFVDSLHHVTEWQCFSSENCRVLVVDTCPTSLILSSNAYVYTDEGGEWKEAYATSGPAMLRMFEYDDGVLSIYKMDYGDDQYSLENEIRVP